jgi:FTR1 family protein
MHHVSATLESFVVALREGIEVALVIGVLLAYLHRSGRRAYGRYVLLGLGAALLASLGGAVVIHRYGLNPEHPVVEGSLMFVAAGLVVSLLLWMWRTGRSIRRRLEQRLDTLVGNTDTQAVASRAALGVFAFAFVMVLREGVETVLFLAALSGAPGGGALTTLGGSGLGFVLAAVFGALLARGSFHVNLQRFFTVTGLVLLTLVAKLVASGLHEFFEAGVLPGAPLLEETVELFASRTASLIILALLIAVPLGCLAWDRARTLRAPAQPNGART